MISNSEIVQMALRSNTEQALEIKCLCAQWEDTKKALDRIDRDISRKVALFLYALLNEAEQLMLLEWAVALPTDHPLPFPLFGNHPFSANMSKQQFNEIMRRYRQQLAELIYRK